MIKTISPQELSKYAPTDKDRVIKLKPYQDGFIFSDKPYPAMVSAWGTGKTMCLVERIRLECEKYPNNLLLVVRKEMTDLRDSTVKDWELYTGMKLNFVREVKFSNGSTVMFRHGEELGSANLNNMNLGGFIIEQAEEYNNEEVFSKLKGRLRRCHGCKKEYNPKTKVYECVCKHWGAIIANTNAHNWIYNYWKASPTEDYDLYEATTYDNADVLPRDFIESFKDLEKKNPAIYRRFVLNSWDEQDANDIIIKPNHVRECINLPLYQDPYDLRRIISIDVARSTADKVQEGAGDETIIYAIENGKWIAKEKLTVDDTMVIVGRAMLFASKHLATNNFAVDEIGVGGGVADRLAELGKSVFKINGAKHDHPNYFNNRSMIYDYAAERFANNQVSIPDSDTELIQQLSWARYGEVKSNGLFKVELKDAIRKRYHRSPDSADAFVNGLYALSKVKKVFVDPRQAAKQTGWRSGAYVPNLER